MNAGEMMIDKTVRNALGFLIFCQVEGCTNNQAGFGECNDHLGGKRDLEGRAVPPSMPINPEITVASDTHLEPVKPHTFVRCVVCGKVFQAKRSSARYCSGSCRGVATRANQRAAKALKNSMAIGAISEKSGIREH